MVEQAIDDAVGAVMAAYFTNLTVPSVLPYRAYAIGGAAVLGAATTNYALTLVEPSEKNLEWAIANPITTSILALGYGTIFDAVFTFVLPEVAIPFPRLNLLVSFAFGGYTAIASGPSVGTLGQMTAWLLGKLVGVTLPEPSIISSSPGISGLPDIWWEGMRDLITQAVWADNVQPMLDDFEGSVVNGALNPASLLFGISRLLLLPPFILSSMTEVMVWHIVRMVAAIIKSVKSVN